MPEIKHQFTGGKMNKDLDERLVPNGEYRDAMNIQVSTSEDSEVGTVQNILGNSSIIVSFVGNNAFCVGSIADEKNDKLYYFVTQNNGDLNHIIEYSQNESDSENPIKPVITDVGGQVLKFDRNIFITGINIIDDMLFWTDNHNEPKKINIPRSILGTPSGGTTHTSFINEKVLVSNDSDPSDENNEESTSSFSTPIREEHITILKKKPSLAPTIKLKTSRDLENFNYSGIMNISPQPIIPFEQGGENISNLSSMWVSSTDPYNHYYDFSQFSIGSVFITKIETDLNGQSGFTLDWSVGDILYFKPFTGQNYDQAPNPPFSDFVLKAKIIEGDNIFTDATSIVSNNSNFTTPNSSGTRPLGWSFESDSASDNTFPNEYNAATSEIVINHPGDNKGKIKQNITWVSGATYIIEVNVSEYTNGSFTFQAVVPRSTFSETGNPYYFRQSEAVSAAGTYSYQFVCLPDENTPTQGWGNYENRVMINFNSSMDGVSFTGKINSITVTRLDAADARVNCEILSIDGVPPTVPDTLSEIKFGVDKFIDSEKIFKYKFPRIAYRYKYQDNEYSAISPFSQVAFLPGSFDFHPKKGYNLGMVNRITEIEVKNFMQNIPDGVVEVDILYKEDSSNNIYIVDTIKPNNDSTHWDEDTYSIESEQINRIIDSNQLLRPWDNVPRKALAQEVSGSRIIYGNYTQGYNMLTDNGKSYYPKFSFQTINQDVTSTVKSVKSLREYQVGVVFVDKYGRETPVISNKSGTEKISKKDADKKNTLQVAFDDIKPPKDLEYFKFFVKETSGEYYNLAMDRYYDADDSQLWLSFPSSDVNKVAIDDFIILKKALEGNDLVTDDTKYKVLDIQNEAPEFIKTKKFLSEEITHRFETNNLFGNSIIDVPLEGLDTFKTFYKPFAQGSSAELHKLGTSLYIDFIDTATEVASKRYQVASLSTSFTTADDLENSKYTFKLTELLGEDVNFITDSPDGSAPTKIREGIAIRAYKYIPKNSTQFDGRFFAKVYNDTSVNSNIVLSSQLEVSKNPKYRVLASQRIYLIDENHTTRHNSQWTGMIAGVYQDQVQNEDSLELKGFGPWACYFRNYRTKPGASIYAKASGTPENPTYSLGEAVSPNTWAYIGPYVFGSKNRSANELAHITGDGFYTTGVSGTGNLQTISNHTNYRENLRGDDHGVNVSGPGRSDSPLHGDNVAVWYINKGPREGNIWNTNVDPQFAFYKISKNYSPSQPGIDENTNINDVENSLWYLNIGGIYNTKNLYRNVYGDGSNAIEALGDEKSIDGFFAVGDTAAGEDQDINENYDGGGTISIAQKLSGGNYLRWKEDPNNNIYRVNSTDGEHGVINWCAGFDQGEGSSSETPDNDFGLFDYGVSTSSNREAAAQLSPNFSVQWRVNATNQNNGGNVSWNPTGELGPIPTPDGLQLTATIVASGTNGFNPFVEVNGLEATNHDGEKYVIQVGMIMVSHSNGSTEYNGINGNGELLIYKITSEGVNSKLHFCGYRRPILNATGANNIISEGVAHNFFTSAPTNDQAMVLMQPTMNGYSQYSCNRINAQDAAGMGSSVFDQISVTPYDDGVASTDGDPMIMPVSYNLEFVQEVDVEPGMPTNPAVWETEPKEEADLDIYYEASGYNPLMLNQENKNIVFPIGSTIEPYGSTVGASFPPNTTITKVDVSETYTNVFNTGLSAWYIETSNDFLSGNIGGSTYLQFQDKLKITRPDGSSVVIKVIGTGNGDLTSMHNEPRDFFYIEPNMYTNTYDLTWHNCFAFGNGVESNRIRDNFNLPFIAKGVKASTTVPLPSEGEEHRKHGLIYSGLYNSISGVNNLNQFIIAEKITKDVNPVYGSIQKLHSRDSDLIALCEDKVLKILANKDAVFNADGNPQLTANQNVLGQTIPFVGEYGISKNPESFASESYRAYFSDKVRGAVLRLSRDGLTPISDAGMKDWFKDNLKLASKIVGSYDDKKDEYNITLHAQDPYTLSFKEDVKGWVSFKAFIPESALSCANEYFTIKDGGLYKHHTETSDRNYFYTNVNPGNGVSYVDVVFNEAPGSVKSFHTMGYEGSAGWKVSKINTSKKQGQIFEFIEKEGKWFNYIKGFDNSGDQLILNESTDFGSFDIQGIGNVKSLDGNFISFNKEVNSSLQVGDTIYYSSVSSNTLNTTSSSGTTKAGKVVFVSGDTIEVDDSGNIENLSDSSPATLGGSNTASSYCLFVKNQMVNLSNFSDYYAIARFENNSTTKAELFSASSEITESSK